MFKQRKLEFSNSVAENFKHTKTICKNSKHSCSRSTTWKKHLKFAYLLSLLVVLIYSCVANEDRRRWAELLIFDVVDENVWVFCNWWLILLSNVVEIAVWVNLDDESGIVWVLSSWDVDETKWRLDEFGGKSHKVGLAGVCTNVMWYGKLNKIPYHLSGTIDTCQIS